MKGFNTHTDKISEACVKQVWFSSALWQRVGNTHQNGQTETRKPVRENAILASWFLFVHSPAHFSDKQNAK